MTGGVKIPVEASSRIKIVRGFSALFWGMPFALLVSVRCAMANWLEFHDGVLPVAAFTLIAFGTWQLGLVPESDKFKFHRILELTKIVAAICAGLSPFIYFWNHHPEVTLFGHTLTALAFFSLFFILLLNFVFRKLAGAIEDEILVSEIDFFTRINLTSLLLLILGIVAIKSSLYLVPGSPFLLIENNIFFPLSQAIGLMFFLIPLSLSMTLLWKIKDAFLADNSEQQEEQESLLSRSDTL